MSRVRCWPPLLRPVWCGLQDDFAPAAIWYTLLTTLGTSPTLVFTALHMEAFVVVRGLQTSDVVTAQVAFAIWNTANDALAGYFSDWWRRAYGSRLVLAKWLSTMWVLCSVLPFVDLPLPTSAHYFMAICIFDGFLSFGCVCRTALAAEIAEDELRRVRLQRWNSVFGNLEGLVTTVAFWCWDPSGELHVFRQFMALAIIVSLGTIWVSSSKLEKFVGIDGGCAIEEDAVASSVLDKGEGPRFQCLGRMMKHRNFVLFCIMNCMLEMQVVFIAQFSVPVANVLFFDHPKPFRLAVVSALPILAGVAAFAASFAAERHGVYAVFAWSGFVRAGMAAVLLPSVALGSHWLPTSAFLVGNAACVHLLRSFAQVCLSNLADEHAALIREAGQTPDVPPISVMQSVASLFAKPFGSLASIAGVVFLAKPTGGEGEESLAQSSDLDDASAADGQRRRLLSALCVAAVGAGAAQTVLLWAYTLQGRRLKEVQALARHRVGVGEEARRE